MHQIGIDFGSRDSQVSGRANSDDDKSRITARYSLPLLPMTNSVVSPTQRASVRRR